MLHLIKPLAYQLFFFFSLHLFRLTPSCCGLFVCAFCLICVSLSTSFLFGLLPAIFFCSQLLNPGTESSSIRTRAFLDFAAQWLMFFSSGGKPLLEHYSILLCL